MDVYWVWSDTPREKNKDTDGHLPGLQEAAAYTSAVVVAGHVVIGCEGYWVINPNAVGIDTPNWQDWTVTP